MYHLLDKFITPLPDTLSQYKSEFHDNFPKLYDTKYVINSSLTLAQTFQNTRYTPLGKCYARVLEDDYVSFQIIKFYRILMIK